MLALFERHKQDRYALPLRLPGVLLDVLIFDQGVVLRVQVAPRDFLSVPEPLVFKPPSYPSHEVFLWAIDGVKTPEEGQHEIGEDEAESSEEADRWEA